MSKWMLWFGVGLGLAGLCVWWAASVREYREQRFDAMVREGARRYGVDPSLVKAVIWRESAFHASARGGAGELGLMQIQELAAIDWSSSQKVMGFENEHLLDPETNIMAGTWYLSHLLKRYRSCDDPEPYALADYNAGRANVLKWIKTPGARTNSALFLKQIGFPSTRKYVEAILRRREAYRTDR